MQIVRHISFNIRTDVILTPESFLLHLLSDWPLGAEQLLAQ